MRVGIGYDIHRLVAGRPLILGGVHVPHAKGLLGHSDGDVLHHAVIDAALGAAGLGDIGDYFSNRDKLNKGRDSQDFVREAIRLLATQGFCVAQIDSVILAEKPMLSMYKKSIRESVAKAWKVDSKLVGIKAKTNEGLDAIGRGQAIASHAVVVLKKINKRK